MSLPVITQRLSIRAEEKDVILIVEPWAVEFTLPIDSQWLIEMEGPDYPHAVIQIINHPNSLVVWGWDGSDFRIVDQTGKMISDWTDNPVPDFIAMKNANHQ
jgi:hypothetical protein